MKKFILCLIMAVLSAPLLHAVKVLDGGGVISRDDASFRISAPKGWIFDNESGQVDELACVMYPADSGWKSSEMIFYANIRHPYRHTLQQFIKEEMDRIVKEYKGLTYTLSPQQKTKSGYTMIVVDSYEPAFRRYERAAYVYTNNAVCMVVINSGNKELFDKNKDKVFEVTDRLSYMEVKRQDRVPRPCCWH